MLDEVEPDEVLASSASLKLAMKSISQRLESVRLSFSEEEIVQLDELLVSVSAGDRQAFAEVYQVSSDLLYSICLRLTRRREIAQEVLQEAFVRIWQKSHLFDKKRGSAIAWMVTVTRRCALNRLRQYDHHEEVLPTDDVERLLEHSSVPAPYDTSSQDLRRCMKALADAERTAISLAFVYGMTHSELAEHLAKPMGTVKSWIKRGLSRLKDCLER